MSVGGMSDFEIDVGRQGPFWGRDGGLLSSESDH